MNLIRVLMTDEKIMTRISRGKLDGAKILFNRYHIRIYNFFLRLTFNREVSLDLMQNVFYRLLKYRDTWKDDRRFSPWIFKICRNEYSDYLRKDGRFTSNSLDIEEIMDCKEFEGFMMDYAAGEIDSDNLKLLISHIKVCDKCREEFRQIKTINESFDMVPDLNPEVDLDSFRDYDMEQKLMEFSRAGKYRRIFIPVGIAASIILFITGFLTGRVHRTNDLKDQEIATLREEVNETKNMMILSLLQQHSASKRIQAASYAEKLDELEPKVIDALLNSLSNDQSTNVRLASLEALSKYTYNPSIRTELIKAFDQESDPVIQVNMINLMVLLNEKSSAVTMQRLVNDDNTNKLVKDQARKGLEILL